MKSTPILFALVAFGLSACDDLPKHEQKSEVVASAGAPEKARQLAEEQLRLRLHITGEMRLRAVQVYPQKRPGSFAVCGQVNPTGEAAVAFTPWVAVVTLPGNDPAVSSLLLAASSTEASRVYIESLERCFEGGGPTVAKRQTSPTLPATPSDAALVQGAIPTKDAEPVPPAPAAPPIAGRTVTTTAAHPVNLRAQPGGTVMRTVPRLSSLRVFGEAPGGWLQVGEEQPFGWVHASMLQRR